MGVELQARQRQIGAYCCVPFFFLLSHLICVRFWVWKFVGGLKSTGGLLYCLWVNPLIRKGLKEEVRDKRKRFTSLRRCSYFFTCLHFLPSFSLFLSLLSSVISLSHFLFSLSCCIFFNPVSFFYLH